MIGRLSLRLVGTSALPVAVAVRSAARQLPSTHARGAGLGHAHLSISSFPHNLLRRTFDYFDRYPFVKYSLVLCGVVLGGSMAVESYSKHRKKQLPQVLSLPARVAHPTLERQAELAALRAQVRAVRRRGEGVVYVVGPSGAGKTELVCQYGCQFIEQALNFTHRFRVAKPAVLYLDGSSPHLLSLSLREAALSLGVGEESLQVGPHERDTLSEKLMLARTLQEKLASNKVPWLIIVDNLTPATQRDAAAIFHAGELEWDWALGHVVATTQGAVPERGKECVINVERNLKPEDALSLLQNVSPASDFSSSSPTLSLLLHSSPLILALAASTVNIYAASLEREPAPQPRTPAVQQYLLLLEEELGDAPTSDDISAVCLWLYLEAAAMDHRVRHTFDLLGFLDSAHPVPSTLLECHLSSSYYQLPLDPPLPPSQGDGQEPSFFAQLKQLLPFGNKPPSASLAPKLDLLHFLRASPLVAFKSYSRGQFELLRVHPSALPQLSSLFLSVTVPQMEEAHLLEAEDTFNHSAWFRHYRKFDASNSVEQYRHSLPGVTAHGILTPDDFSKSHYAEDGLTYPQYLHLLSHNHRVLSSLLTQLKAADDDFASTQFCRYLRDHLSHLTHGPLSQSDLVMCSYGLASAASVTSRDPHTTLTSFQAVLQLQTEVLGPHHPALARTRTDIADVLFSLGDIVGAREQLESAVRLYQILPTRSRGPSVDLELGLAVSSLAVVVSSLGEKARSRELLEQALSLYQSVPAGEAVSLHQRRLVANTLTDLAHAYLTLGEVVAAQKYIELSMMAQPTVYPEGGPETVRAFSVASLVYALLGDQRESVRVREEAGKLQKQLKKQMLYM